MTMLAVPKDFPVWDIKSTNTSQSSIDELFQCLSSQIFAAVKCDRCEYSLLIDALAPRSSTLICLHIVFKIALKTYNPRTVSQGIYYARNHTRLELYEIYKLRYTRFCRIVIGEKSHVSKLNDTPETFSESDVFGSVYILFLNAEESFKNQRILTDIFQKLRNVLFLSCNHFKNSAAQPIFPNIFITTFNWNKLPLISTSDLGAPFHLAYYQKTGKWTHFILAAYHYVALRINATNDQIYVFAAPRLKSFENGIWDEYIKPLVFKEAHISVVRIRENDVETHYVYHSVPVYFDHFTFITAVPRDLGSNAFFANYSDVILILGVVISTTFGIFLIKLLETILSANTTTYSLGNSFKGLIKFIANIFQTVLKPILDQPMLSQTPQMSAEMLGPSYIIYALWLVMVMTMSNIYKCNFVSEILSPNLENMPESFQSLIDLKFKTKALFFKDNMDLKFAGAPNPVNVALLTQTEDCNFMDPECCYQSLLRWNTACLGTKKVFESFATRFLVDEHGNNMFTYAPDERFPFFTANGVSKYFPEILEYLNYVQTQMEESGMKQHAVVLKEFEEMKDGRNFARHKVSPSSEFYSIYQGNTVDVATNDRKLVKFLFKLFLVPLSISSLVFLTEMVKMGRGSTTPIFNAT